jgi:CheY-like chemotaxis protein
MPEMDGFALSERILRQPELSCRIILLTSGGQRGDAARCRELGIAGYLTKPVRQGELQTAIARAVGHESGFRRDSELITRHSLQEHRAGLRILVAEDNAVNQHLVRRLLEKCRHTVRFVDNGVEAVQAAGEEDFDLILMDVQMPEMDGLEATARIRQAEKETGTRRRIYAMTAHAMSGDRELCLAAGMDGYLSKPIRTSEFAQVLAAVEAEVARSLALAGSMDAAGLEEKPEPVTSE